MRSLAVFGLASAASAFLVITEGSNVKIDVIPDEARNAFAQSVNLDCPGCPVQMPHSSEYTTEMESHLELDFTVDLSSGDRLLLNGFELYPHADPFSSPLSAAHIVDMPSRDGMMRGGMMHASSNNMMNSIDVLGFTLLSKTYPPNGADDMYDHVKIDLQIIEISNVFVGSIPAIHIHLLRDEVGLIAIESIETADPEGVATTAIDGEEKHKCDNWFCSLIQSFEDHWNHWRPHCGMGQKHPHGPGHHNGTHHGPHGHHGHHEDDEKPDPEMAYHGYGGHRHPRTWSHFLKSIITHILLPIFIGIMAGMIMSSIGMLVGTFTVHVYRRFFRSSCPRRRVIVVGSVAHEEKEGLMEHQEPPPSYEEGTPAEHTDAKV